MARLKLPSQDTGLWARIRSRLDRALADPAFQQWAARSPLTGWFARRKARALFDIAAGFVYSQVLAACIKLQVFELLREGSRDVDSIAAETGLEPAAALRLLKAASALGLVKALASGRFALDDLGAATLGNPEVAAFVAHHDILYGDLADPVALLRGERQGQLAQFWPYAANRPGDDGGVGSNGDTAAYSALMSQTQALVADAVLEAYPFGGRKRLLDVGGGEGDFAATAAQKFPGLRITSFDLPSVAERAQAKLETLGLARRVAVVGGDMLHDPLPGGCDVVTLVRVLHDHDDDSALTILKAVHDALTPNGEIVVAEPMSGIRGAEPMGDAYFGFYLFAMGRGRPRTPGEIADLLLKTGFVRPLRLRTPNPLTVSVVTAFRV